jgi:type II secretory pathway component GspD/PulD (secretin)
VTQNGYVASVQNTSTGGGGTSTAAQNTVTSQVTPGNLITGLTLYVLPKIRGDKIFLQINADLSTNDGFTTFGTPGTTTATAATLIQLPNITEKSFNQRSVLRSGDTLILSGFRQTTNRANANQFITLQALGGKGAQQLNKETIVLITPIILNECA